MAEPASVTVSDIDAEPDSAGHDVVWSAHLTVLDVDGSVTFQGTVELTNASVVNDLPGEIEEAIHEVIGAEYAFDASILKDFADDLVEAVVPVYPK